MIKQIIITPGDIQSCVPSRHWPVIVLLSVMSACSTFVEIKDSAPSTKAVDIDSIPDAVPRVEPTSRYGNPEQYEVFGKRYYVLKDNSDYVERGIASWYGEKFHGRRTSSGETYDMYAMTAAHKNLLLPTYVEVTNLQNNRRIIVRVNDRGPFHDNRIIDLSYSAARKLDIVAKGTGLVEVRAIAAGRYAKGDHREDKAVSIPLAPLTKPVDGFYIQVGAFGEEINARRLQRKISTLGDKLVKIRQTEIDGQTIFRVQIGPLDNVDTADHIVARLGDLGITEHRIVVDR